MARSLACGNFQRAEIASLAKSRISSVQVFASEMASGARNKDSILFDQVTRFGD